MAASGVGGAVRLALKVAYDGSRFQGSQRQPPERSTSAAGVERLREVRTVEGELLRGLARLAAVEDAAAAAFEMAGRTDAGVDAAGNVVAFDTEFASEKIQRGLNGNVRDVWVLARAEVPTGWSPRRAAVRRTYLYHGEPAGDVSLANAALSRFLGEHDLTSFCRATEGRSPWGRVDVARVEEADGLWTYTVAGPAFLWNQVRRMVSAAEAVARGEAAVADVERGLAGDRVDLGVAAPEGLVLADVAYRGLTWVSGPKDREDLLATFRRRRLAARATELHQVLFEDAAARPADAFRLVQDP